MRLNQCQQKKCIENEEKKMKNSDEKSPRETDVSGDSLRIKAIPHPFKFEKSPDKALNELILGAINSMGRIGENAEELYQQSLERLRSSAEKVMPIILSEYNDLPEMQYLDRWSLIQLLAELKHPSSLKFLDEILVTPIPPERSKDPRVFSTRGEEAIIRTTATDLVGNSLFSPSLEVEIIPDSDSIKSNRVMGITFKVTYDQTPVEGAFVSLSVSMGELSQLGASTFSDGTNRVKYTAPSVQENTTMTITAEAGKFGFQGGSTTYDIIIEPGTGYGNITSESEFPWHKYIGYIVALVVLIVLNIALVVMLIKRRREEKLGETT